MSELSLYTRGLIVQTGLEGARSARRAQAAREMGFQATQVVASSPVLAGLGLGKLVNEVVQACTEVRSAPGQAQKATLKATRGVGHRPGGPKRGFTL